MSDAPNLAFIMIKEVRDALTRGTKHYRKSDDKLLITEKEIIEALLAEGEIMLDCRDQCAVG